VTRARAPRRHALLALLGVTLCGGLPALAAEPLSPPPPPASTRGPPEPPALSEEDREVVDNLTLLESLEAADALDVVLALEDEPAG
jgi:hypothetical protein